MEKPKKKRRFESETMALPALKMVLVDMEKNNGEPSSKKTKRKAKRELTEETVMRIIRMLNTKE
jgi:hypothetical protein